ncbi:hypothetical protein ACHAL6_13860 [Proteiniclasticum sp. C24MP]|uniref:hypothetical protein n=1 Tax=Proteiniclasticum sp. C24MP TaxID=3374101 RepID=UPI00375420DC
MIIINMPLKRDFVKELLDGKNIEGIDYRFLKQENMKLYFEVSEESERAASVAKAAIKKSELGPALFFMVEHVR